MPALLLGVVIGLTFAAAGTTVLSLLGELRSGSRSRSRHTVRISAAATSGILSATALLGGTLGALL